MKAHLKYISRLLLLNILPMVVGLAVLIFVIAFLSGVFRDKISPGTEVSTVRKLEKGQQTAQAKKVSRQAVEEVVGTLKAAKRTTLSSKVLATVKNVLVVAGSSVKPGDVLVELSSPELESRLHQAEAQLNSAKAAREQAKLELFRTKQVEIRSPGAITQDRMDRLIAHRDMAIANVNQWTHAVAEARTLLSYTTIKAPERGRMIERLVQLGDTVRPGDPLLTLYDPQSLRLEAPVPECLAVRLKKGNHLWVYIDSLRRKVPTTVDEIVPQAETLSRSFLVKVTLDSSAGLYEGMFGRLYIPTATRDYLCVPMSAVGKIGQLPTVDIMQDVPVSVPRDAHWKIGQLDFVDVVRKDKTLERRLVKTGRIGHDDPANPLATPDRIEIISGLQPGETIVLYPRKAIDSTHQTSTSSMPRSIPSTQVSPSDSTTPTTFHGRPVDRVNDDSSTQERKGGVAR